MRAADVCVVGAGSSGLAALKALGDAGISAECFERGSDVGGNWRYENDSGMSAAYESLRCNVSRKRMQYRSFRMPRSLGQFPGHRDMAAYFAAYADAFGLRDRIRFCTTVERLEPEPGGGWQITLHDGTTQRYRAAVVASGRHWAPKYPDWATEAEIDAIHSHDYRVPEPFAGKRVLVVGAGQSGAEIAVELSSVAEHVSMSVRRGVHLIPRWILGRPMDELDVFPINTTYWPLMNWNFRQLARLSGWRSCRNREPPAGCSRTARRCHPISCPPSPRARSSSSHASNDPPERRCDSSTAQMKSSTGSSTRPATTSGSRSWMTA